MNKDPNPNKPGDISDQNSLIIEIIAYWKEIARRNFYKAHPNSTPGKFEHSWPKSLTNFFLTETIRIANALRSLSEDREN
jgi:hypothetical protein